MGKSSKNKPWNSLQGYVKRFNYDYYYDVFFFFVVDSNRHLLK